jgi:hypothetical protein
MSEENVLLGLVEYFEEMRKDYGPIGIVPELKPNMSAISDNLKDRLIQMRLMDLPVTCTLWGKSKFKELGEDHAIFLYLDFTADCFVFLGFDGILTMSFGGRLDTCAVDCNVEQLFIDSIRESFEDHMNARNKGVH